MGVRNILAIHGELIDGSGLYEILSKCNISIIGTQNPLTSSQQGIVLRWQHHQSI